MSLYDDIRTYRMIRDVHRARRARRFWMVFAWYLLAVAVLDAVRFVMVWDWYLAVLAVGMLALANLGRINARDALLAERARARRVLERAMGSDAR